MMTQTYVVLTTIRDRVHKRRVRSTLLNKLRDYGDTLVENYNRSKNFYSFNSEWSEGPGRLRSYASEIVVRYYEVTVN